MRNRTIYLCLHFTILFVSNLVAQIPDTSMTCGLEDLDTTATTQYPRPDSSQLPYKVSTNHFVVHYATSGLDSFSLAGAQNVATMAESCWARQIGRMDWLAPIPDGISGGDNRYDIYVEKLAVAGVTEHDYPTHRSYILLANKFAGGSDRSNATLAHEFNHSSQWTYALFREADRWIWEGTADYMMKEVLPTPFAIGIYKGHASGMLFFPNKSLTQGTDDNAFFLQYLRERWNDTGLVRSTWQRFKDNDGDFPLTVLGNELFFRHAVTLDSALAEYAIWRLFTNFRADSYHFQDASTGIVPFLVEFPAIVF